MITDCLIIKLPQLVIGIFTSTERRGIQPISMRQKNLIISMEIVLKNCPFTEWQIREEWSWFLEAVDRQGAEEAIPTYNSNVPRLLCVSISNFTACNRTKPRNESAVLPQLVVNEEAISHTARSSSGNYVSWPRYLKNCETWAQKLWILVVKVKKERSKIICQNEKSKKSFFNSVCSWDVDFAKLLFVFQNGTEIWSGGSQCP